MRAMIVLSALASVASANAALAADFYLQPAPLIISNYAQPTLVASYPNYSAPVVYYHCPAVVDYQLAGAVGGSAIAGSEVVSYEPRLYRARDIYYRAPPSPPDMLEARLGAHAEGKRSTMQR